MRFSFLRALSALAVALFACLGAAPAGAATLEDRFETTLALDPDTEFVLGNHNGRIEVATWDRPEVRLVAEKRVEARSSEAARRAMEELDPVVTESAGRIEIETPNPDEGGGILGWLFGDRIDARVHYTLTVPRRAKLDLTTVNGRIRVEDAGGELALTTVNGRIEARGIEGSLAVRTTNGAVDAEIVALDSDDEVQMRTTNGRVRLALPADVRASAQMRTTNGSFRTDFPIEVDGPVRRRNITADLNGGGAKIEIRTVNGGVTLAKL